MTSGGDGDDDAQLRAMRSVWLSLPDEEPPQGGMTELLAAARAKAADMQDRPRRRWWIAGIVLAVIAATCAIAALLIER